MSHPSIADFHARLAADEGMRQELRDSAGIGDVEGITTGALIEFAASKGYEISADDVRRAEMALSDGRLLGPH